MGNILDLRRLSYLALAICAVLLLWPAQAVQAQAKSVCYQPARLSTGTTAQVTAWPDLPNRIRSGPGYHLTVVGRIPATASFSVIDGPLCVDNLHWWRINYNGIVGWTAEGNGYNTYWLEPVAHNPPLVCVMPTRLTIGGQGRVLPGLPNVVRTAPGTTATGANSQVIGRIPADGVFDVLNGPQCGTDGRWWWYVNYQGLVGWTAEGEGYDSYWIAPLPHPALVQCPGALPSRLVAGRIGAVTSYPDLPNVVRSQPDANALRVGLIPVGGVFHVLSGPFCTGNDAWWQVGYDGIVGWTIESGAGNYWLEPR